jgi:RNA polymerase sigma-70 factor (ECF subfamily)
MFDNDWLAQRFESDRDQLRAVASRMLGPGPEADDVVQDAWLRLSRSGAEGVGNLTGWLTTVVARLCLDVLRGRRARPDEPLGDEWPEVGAERPRGPEPEPELLLADSLGPALLVVLDSLTPAERLAFVLHDVFAVPFDEIGAMIGRSPVAARQLASRARRRVRGGRAAEGGSAREREIVTAFLAASREGDIQGLIDLLDPDVVLRADAAAVEAAAANRVSGAPAPVLAREARGARAVAATFSGRARPAKLALVDGGYGAVFSVGGKPWAVFGFSIVGDRIVEVEIMTDPSTLERVEIARADS